MIPDSELIQMARWLYGSAVACWAGQVQLSWPTATRTGRSSARGCLVALRKIFEKVFFFIFEVLNID